MTEPLDTPTPPSDRFARRRSLWMFAFVAVGFGPMLASVLVDEQLGTLASYMVNSMGLADDRSSIHLIRILMRFLLPTLLVLTVLRFTRIGQWFALTPLTLTLLAVGDTMLILNLVDQLRLYVLSGYPSFRFSGEVAAVVFVTTLCLSAVTLAISTAWYRSEASRHWLGGAARRWLREA